MWSADCCSTVVDIRCRGEYLETTLLARVLGMQAHGQSALVVGGSKGVGLAVGLLWLTFALYCAMN